MGVGKQKGLASTPCEVPSNFFSSGCVYGTFLDLLAGFKDSEKKREVWKVWLKQGWEEDNKMDWHLSRVRSHPTFQQWLLLTLTIS